MQERIIDLLKRTGPMTGAEISESLDGEAFGLWKTCMLSPRLAVLRVGRRYVRLDRRVEGYARLSPSILREFLTYTVVGVVDDPAAMDARHQRLQAHIKSVSRHKLELATRVMTEIAEPPGTTDKEEMFCVAIAGDVVYEMAHDVNRPERSTGGMVHGSDLDIVVIASDEASDELLTGLDDAIYKKKHQYLKNPAFREEIDYVVKRFSKVREQAEFDSFKRMVACKILDEAILVCGSEELLADAKALLCEGGVLDRLRDMERSAIRAREQAEQQLLANDEEVLGREDLFLFYTDEESEEFE